MLRVPTALLLHTTPDGRHYDWLVGTPGYGANPQARLWTARVGHASGVWQQLGTFPLEVLAPHRAAYLTYQGQVSDGRGVVTRVDQGRAVIERWHDKCRVLSLETSRFRGRLRIEERAPGAWRARVIGT